jgi:hypothetical protein
MIKYFPLPLLSIIVSVLSLFFEILKPIFLKIEVLEKLHVHLQILQTIDTVLPKDQNHYCKEFMQI